VPRLSVESPPFSAAPQPQWYQPPPRARASRSSRPLPAAPGSASAHHSSLDAQLRGKRPLCAPRPAKTTAAGRAAPSVYLVTSGIGSACPSLPCPPPDIGFPRTKRRHPLLKVYSLAYFFFANYIVSLTDLSRCLVWGENSAYSCHCSLVTTRCLSICLA
jgi:hypothetical protein